MSEAVSRLTYGMYLLTAREGDKDNGCIINTAMQITISPERVVIAVNKDNLTHQMIKATGEFNLSILNENAKFDTFRTFGYQSGRGVDKFAKIEFFRSGNGLAYIADEANSFISCEVEKSEDMGSHTVFYGKVMETEILNDIKSMSYEYYQKNIKEMSNLKIAKDQGQKECSKNEYKEGKKERLKNEYREKQKERLRDEYKEESKGESKEPKNGWICVICGFIYEGEELPADFICPVCKHGVDDFKKLE